MNVGLIFSFFPKILVVICGRERALVLTSDRTGACFPFERKGVAAMVKKIIKILSHWAFSKEWQSR